MFDSTQLHSSLLSEIKGPLPPQGKGKNYIDSQICRSYYHKSIEKHIILSLNIKTKTKA